MVRGYDANKYYVGKQFTSFRDGQKNVIQVGSSLGFVMPRIANWIDSAKINHGFTTNKTKNMVIIVKPW